MKTAEYIILGFISLAWFIIPVIISIINSKKEQAKQQIFNLYLDGWCEHCESNVADCFKLGYCQGTKNKKEKHNG